MSQYCGLYHGRFSSILRIRVLSRSKLMKSPPLARTPTLMLLGSWGAAAFAAPVHVPVRLGVAAADWPATPADGQQKHASAAATRTLLKRRFICWPPFRNSYCGSLGWLG